MNKAKTKKLLITLLCFAMVASVSATVLAMSGEIGRVSIEATTSATGTGTVTKVGNNVISIIRVVGIIISVGVLMLLGIKYMMGSAEEKAEYKKTFIPYIVGAVILFAAAVFAKSIYDFAASISAE